MNAVLEEWNHLEAEAATGSILPCCGSRQWAVNLTHQRPFADAESLLAASDKVWLQLDRTDWDEAFASHPRIGARNAPAQATKQSAQWSAEEQSSVNPMDLEVHDRLQSGNAAYEQRFGRTFIVRASGRSAQEMLEILHKRLVNTPEQELQEAVEQQRQITQLRLRNWLRL